jgi:hypothetical protein
MDSSKERFFVNYLSVNNKKREYLKDTINELATHSKNIRDICIEE